MPVLMVELEAKKIIKKNSLLHVYDMSEKLCSYLSFDGAYGEDWEWISEFVDDKNQAHVRLDRNSGIVFDL